MNTQPKPNISLVHRPESEVALVIRRGPRDRVAFFGWNRTTNSIMLGQWLKGKVYSRRCDISPDGNHIIYFAYNHGRFHEASTETWTTVSCFPYMKALDFWPKGETYNGGGLFNTNSEYLLHENRRFAFRHMEHTLSNKFNIIKGVPASPIENNECLGIYSAKLIRDGWNYLGAEGDSSHQFYKFSKHISKHLRIQKDLHTTSSPPEGKGCYFEEHFIHGVKSGQHDFRDIQYLDFYQGKIFWPENWAILTSEIQGQTICAPTTVHDFSNYSFERIQAPY